MSKTNIPLLILVYAIAMDNPEESSSCGQISIDKLLEDKKHVGKYFGIRYSKLIEMLMEAENKIETTLKAQGFEDVLCYLSDNSANIIVKSSGLDTAQAAQIKSALLSEVEVAGENITIVEVQ